MSDSLKEALKTPNILHTVACALICQQCQMSTTCLIRGISMIDLVVLGDLFCSKCGGADLVLNPEDKQAVLEMATRLMSSPKRLPHGFDAFLYGGEFNWQGEIFEDPRELRAVVEQESRAKPGDAAAQLAGALAMSELRDMRRALELSRRAHDLSPSSPQPLLFAAQLLRVLDMIQEAHHLSKQALSCKDGPLLLPIERATLIEDIVKQVANTAPSRSSESTKTIKVGRNDPCPCSSGKKFKKCCGAGL